MLTVYGIGNCDTVKKACNWLKKANVPFRFHDYKQQGVTQQQLEAWSRQVGRQKLLNPKSTTWRNLSEAEKALAAETAGAIQLMTENTSLIKRPLIEQEGRVRFLGFDPNAYEALFGQLADGAGRATNNQQK